LEGLVALVVPPALAAVTTHWNSQLELRSSTCFAVAARYVSPVATVSTRQPLTALVSRVSRCQVKVYGRAGSFPTQLPGRQREECGSGAPPAIVPLSGTIEGSAVLRGGRGSSRKVRWSPVGSPSAATWKV
jgi:hypothetical protein